MRTGSQSPICANLTELDGAVESTLHAASQGALPSLGATTPLTDHLSLHAPVGLGSLDPSLSERVLIEHSTSLGRCAEPAVELGLVGTIEIHVRIHTSGAVVHADVRADSLGHSATGACLADVLKSLPFPPPSSGGGVASYLFAVGR